uniref:Cyclin-dependent protein kinase n=1 Tax=Marseillevirus LCMAC103 TaxID=2506604 RepID=A0A481YU06_9VIRU|nr:MAG: cyclin-dependent protein kinase [Marseillevirus LCMAC103]
MASTDSSSSSPEGTYGFVVFTDTTARKYSKTAFNDDGMCNQQNIRECAAIRALSHENVISARSITMSQSPRKSPGTPPTVVVIEMAKGDPVAGEQRVDDAAIGDFFRQVAGGLAHAHARDIANRDIKPENLVTIDEGKTYKIIDWGIAGFACSERLSESSEYVSLWWRSPELLAGEAHTDHRAADVWALGITALSLFFDIERLQAEDIQEQLHAAKWLASRAGANRLNEYYDDRISPLLADLLKQIFQVDWRSRITAAEICDHPFVAGYIKLRNGRHIPKKVPRSVVPVEENHEWRTTLFGAQKHLTPRMREILFEWLCEVQTKFKLRFASLFSAYDLVDRALRVLPDFPRRELQLLGTACLALATCLYETYPPELRDFVCVAARAFTSDELEDMAQKVAFALDWHLVHDTCYTVWLSANTKPSLSKLVVAAAVAEKCGLSPKRTVRSAFGVTADDCRPQSGRLRKLVSPQR